MPHIEDLQELPAAVLPGGVVPLGDLPPAGDTGLATQELIAAIPELVGLLQGDGPGADDGEVALEYVQELRELIQGGLAQKASHTGDPWVVIEFLLASPHLELLRGHVPLGVLVGVGHHGAELVDVDGLAAPAHPLLAEEGLPRGVGADGGAGGRHGQGQDRADAGRERDVEGPLGRPVPGAARPRGGDAIVGGGNVEGRAGVVSSRQCIILQTRRNRPHCLSSPTYGVTLTPLFVAYLFC